MNPTTIQTPKYVVRAAVKTTLAPKGTKMTGTLYYGASQQLSVAPNYLQVPITMTSFKTSGIYTIYQGVVTQPQTGGVSHIDVQLGTTQRSAKSWVSLFGGSFFGLCSNADMTTC